MASTASVLEQVGKRLGHTHGGAMTDAALLALFIQTHSDAAMADLIRRHGPVVWGVCRRMLSNHADAEDAFQSVWIVLARKARHIHQPERLVQWLYGTARHAALNLRKVRRRRTQREQSWPETYDVADPVQQAWNDVRPVVDDELARLPVKYQLPLMLCCLQGKTHQEAAEQLAWPVGTVAGRLSRGREMLRQRLIKRGIQVAPALFATILTQEVMAGALPSSLVLAALKGALAYSTTSVVGTSAAGVASTLMHQMVVRRWLYLVCCVVGLGALGVSIGFTYWVMTDRSEPVQQISEGATPTIQHRTVALPADPLAVILHWKLIDLDGNVPDTEVSLHANGLLTASKYHPDLQASVTYERQLNEQTVQELMQYAVHDQQALTIHAQATWKQLKQEYQFEGDQRTPNDTWLTLLKVQTAANERELGWYQLSSSEAWFHEVPAVRQMAALQRRLRNLVLVMEAGGEAAVNRIGQQLTQELRVTYPTLAPFTASNLSNVTYPAGGDARQLVFTQGTAYSLERFFIVTCEATAAGIRLVAVTPGPVVKLPAMKRRPTITSVR